MKSNNAPDDFEVKLRTRKNSRIPREESDGNCSEKKNVRI